MNLSQNAFQKYNNMYIYGHLEIGRRDVKEAAVGSVWGVQASEILETSSLLTICSVTDEREARQGVLQQSRLFSQFFEQEVARWAARMVRRLFFAGKVLFAEGDACLGLSIAVTGWVRIFETPPGSRKQMLAVEDSGSTVSKLPVFDCGGAD